ncbi:MAG: outer membrane beta-barrel protein [Bacteroidota bacterium]|nr:outer membrane beta-barrel protein [Bacteroidota bacterium]
MKTKLLCMALFLFMQAAIAQDDSTEQVNRQKGEPLEGMDMTWLNGGDRRSSPTLAGKYFTPTVMLDANYTYSFNNPIDNTVVGSTALARNNEMQVSAVYLGGDFTFNGARAHIVTQFGTRSILVPRNDYSVYHGQYQLADVYRFLAEANAGYHFKVLYGVNVDAGMFMSYIGLNSYYQTENWEYQASFTSDNTPWYFNGMRIQIFATKKLKIEPWIINGWQSYGMFNKQPGIGGNISWCPNENIKLITNNYYGADAAGIPSRKRFHTDNSFLLRYYNVPSSKKISKMAFSITGDIGFEKGGGVNGFKNGNATQGPAQYFLSLMAYNRVWFAKNKFAWTAGGGYMKNPGRYLVLYPAGDASPLPNPTNPTTISGTHPFSANAGDPFEGWDVSTNIDWMANEHILFRFEYVHRESSVPYFAGRGGVTSPSGYTTTPLTPGWVPDLVKSEDRIIFALLFRL